jgi:adenylate cyclase
MPDVRRRLTVVVSADVVGYSALMERDEAGTLARLKANRATVFDPRVAAHDGRIVKLMGDGALVEFGSVVSALSCMLEIQEATEAERSVPDRDRIRYRVGITLGEVIVEGDDIYGDGVNVAARLQALASPGQVAVSGAVHDQAVGRIPLEFDDLGEHTVPNRERPIHVYAVHPRGGEPAATPAAAERARVSICVLPFANMSGDPEQEYFSDGITEDIITDLSKVSSLWVAARNTSFTFKGKHVDASQVARKLRVSHLLEGSVRKAGGRVRVTAQLIEGTTGGHIWAERYDRDLKDIFGLQDEISQAIVGALKLKLLPEEKRAIEQRGTSNAEAYKLYLMARQYSVSGNLGSARRSEAIIRLCRRATEIDPDYARPWALMAVAQMNLRFHMGTGGDDGLEAAEGALALDPNLAEAHAAKARVLTQNFRFDEAQREVDTALRLDGESYEANSAAGRLSYYERRFADAIPYYEKAASLMESDYLAAGILISCYKAVGDKEGVRRCAHRALARAEKIVALEPDNGSATGFAVLALAALGEAERAKEWAERALLLDPDNLNLRYNLACTLVVELREFDAALDLLAPAFEKLRLEAVNSAKTDPDLDLIREHPRFKAMVAAAEARLAQR